VGVVKSSKTPIHYELEIGDQDLLVIRRAMGPMLFDSWELGIHQIGGRGVFFSKNSSSLGKE